MIARFLLLMMPVLLLAGCGVPEEGRVAVAIIDNSADPFAADAAGPAALAWRSATAEGLVGFDPYGRVVPALADRWIVTDDGTSYIFRLRDGTWPGGDEIDAASARAALSAAIGRQRGTPLGADLGRISEVRAMAGRVLEIRLNQPVPELLTLLAGAELGLLHGRTGAGPMRSRAAPTTGAERRSVVLAPIPPGQRGLPAQPGWADNAREIELHALSAESAVRAFASGRLRAVLGGTIADFLLSDRTGLSRGALRVDDVEGLFGLAFVHQRGFLYSAENRAALAMAIDRQALMENFGIGNWEARLGMLPREGPTGRLLPVAQWRDLPIEQRRRAAAARVAEWRGSRGAVAPLRIALPAGASGAMLYDRLAADFTAIGIETRRVGLSDAADLALLDRVAPTDNVEWYLNRFRCGLARRICIPEVDALLREARSDTPRAASGVLIDEAAAMIEAQQIFISFGQPVRWSLVGGGIDGFQTNALGVHPLMEIAMQPK